MTSSTGFSAGEVVKVSFLFTAQNQAKTRPAIVLSTAAFHASRADLIMMPISTKSGGYFGDRPLMEWRAAGLSVPCNIKAVIQTIPKTSIKGRFGRLSSLDEQQVRETLAAILYSFGS